MYNFLARELMFGRVCDTDTTLIKHQLQYRVGKSKSDIQTAITKALKNGHQKTETELSMLEVYLKQVLKPLK